MTTPIFIRLTESEIAKLTAIADRLPGWAKSTTQEAIRYAIDTCPLPATTQPEGHDNAQEPHAAQDEPQQYQPPE